MKKVLSALALAAFAVGAHAQVTFSGGTNLPAIGGYNPNGPAGTVAPLPVGGKENATITATAGGLTATFLGFEALDTDLFNFVLSSGTLSNQGVLGSSIFGAVAAGNLNFTFMDMTSGTSVGNGGSAGPFTSYAVLGSFVNAVFVPYTLGGAYDLVIGFNDGLRVDADYDDLVIGLKVTPVPEPETYALMLAGLGALGFISRRRRKTIDA